MGVATPIAALTDTLSGGTFKENYNRQRELNSRDWRVNPGGSLTGTVAGGVGGVYGLERSLERGAAKLPGFLNWAKPAIASPRTADFLYGAGSGAIQSEDGQRLSGAVTGGLGGTAGGMVGRQTMRSVGGVASGVRDDAVRYLADRGVNMTPGQILGQGGIFGRTLKGTEDALESMPYLGSAIKRMRGRSVEDFNRAGFAEQGASVGLPGATDINEQGVEQAFATSSQGFGNALNGRSIPIDPAAQQNIGAAIAAGRGVPTYGDDFDVILKDQIAPLGSGNSLTGAQFQDVDRAVNGYARKYADMASGQEPKPLAGRVANAFRDISRELNENVERNAGDMLPKYRAAQKSYREANVLQDAVTRARVGTRSGQPGMFMPSQLADAASANAKKFGGTQGTTSQPFFELTRAGQKVLPSDLPNSGTADRAAALLLPGLLTGGAVAGQQAGWIDPKTAALIAAVGAAYTKPGQKLIQAALTSRNPKLRAFGDATRDRARLGGIFGASLGPTTLPLLFPSE